MYRHFLSADFVCGVEWEEINKQKSKIPSLDSWGWGTNLTPKSNRFWGFPQLPRIFQFLEFFVFCSPELTVMASMQNCAE